MTFASLANQLYLAGAGPAHLRFARALRRPRETQLGILRSILRQNETTWFARQHGFRRMESLRDFREGVPIRDYQAYAPLTDRVMRGEEGILTRDRVRFVEPSGGTTGGVKQIPYTGALLREFSAAISPWLFDLLRHRPRLRRGRAYWAVSPPARHPTRTVGGIPVGMEHDSDYFPPVVRWLLDRVLGVPRAVSQAPDVPTCRYLTLRSLLAMPDLALISVWSPSFLTLLADALDQEFERLLHDLESGRLSVELSPALRSALARALPARPRLARRLRARFGRSPPEDLGAVWPGLALISCWADGHAARALSGMRRRFPRVEVQAKGLLATEGVVSIPLIAAGAPVAAVTSHFLEFLEPDGGEDTCLVDELETGRTYEVVLTTGGGFYRYRLNDLVRVEGWYHRAPLLSFAGRADRASDLAGEKLTAEHAERVIAAAVGRTGVRPTFAMLAPSWGAPPHYRLYAEVDAEAVHRLALAVEDLLLESHHYALCRSLGQLGAVDGVRVTAAERTYERVCAARGQRVGGVKPAALDPALDWESAFDPLPCDSA